MHRILTTLTSTQTPRALAVLLMALAVLTPTALGQAYSPAPGAEADDYLVTAYDQIRTPGESEQRRQYIDRVINEFSELVNGRWILVDRFNPDGSRHAEPLQGWTDIHLTPIRTITMTTRAFGTISSEEMGVWDERMGQTGPPEAIGKPFFVESNGTWEVMFDPEVDIKVGAGKAHILVAQMGTVRGTYAPYSGGLISQLDSRYEMTLSHTEVDEQGRTVKHPTRLLLKMPITPHRPETFRGRTLPNDWLVPLNFEGEAIPESDLASSDCSVKAFSVEGEEMHIEWSSGARDYWIKDAESVIPEDAVPQTPTEAPETKEGGK
ncbi:MAG TPA: hypothetical protein VLV83_09220 [Acidobacteriota bacterium]|nr:hypothetical protein [Acidobacteriota bacterium]